MNEDALDEIRGWLKDVEQRRLYGAENVRLELALALAQLRKSQGLTQKQFADLAGVTQAYIAKLESGDANPTIGHIGGIVATLWCKPTFKFLPLLKPAEMQDFQPRTGPSAIEDYDLDILATVSASSDSTSADFIKGLLIGSRGAA